MNVEKSDSTSISSEFAKWGLGDNPASSISVFSLSAPPKHGLGKTTPHFQAIFIHRIASYLQNLAIDSRVSDELDALYERIRGEVDDWTNAGFLIQVPLFQEDTGIIHVNPNSILKIVGIGTDPVDALAEDMRKDSWDTPRWRGLGHDKTYYIWISQHKNMLFASRIEHPTSKILESNAIPIAEKRKRVTAFQGHQRSDDEYFITKANYWIEARDQRLANSKREDMVDDIKMLTNQMSSQQQQFNELASTYYSEAARIEEKARQYGWIKFASQLTSLVTDAWASSGQQKDIDTGQPTEGWLDEMRARESLLLSEIDRLDIKADRLLSEMEKVVKTNAGLKKMYDESNILLPSTGDLGTMLERIIREKSEGPRLLIP